ncbi:MAG: GNAT family protein [Paracoccaceae bacterium]
MTLRRAEAGDLPRIAGLIASHPHSLLQQAPGDIEALAADPAARLLVWQGPDGEFAGFAAIEPLYPQVVFLTNLALVRPGRGAGLALIRAALAVAFDEMGAHRLFCDIAFDNAAGLAAFARAGLVREGTMRQCWLRDGTWVDCHAYAMLRAEWEMLR